MEMNKNTGWLIVDLIIVFAIAGILIWSFLNSANPLANTFGLVLVGVIFLTSNKFKDKLYISRISYWISFYTFRPQTTINHIIIGSFAIFFGIILVNTPYSKSDEEFFQRLLSGKEFWLSIAIIMIFIVIVGYYTAKKNRKRNARPNRDAHN